MITNYKSCKKPWMKNTKNVGHPTLIIKISQNEKNM